MSLELNPRGLFPFSKVNSHYRRVSQDPINPYFNITKTAKMLDYLDGEVLELREAIEHKHSPAHIQEELGDVLMTASIVGRSVGVNPNLGMVDSLKKVQDRIRFVKERDPRNANQFQKVWEMAKQQIG